MFRKTTMALAATLILGSASLALADDYTDQAADALRNYGPVAAQQAPLTSRNVALPHNTQIRQQNDSAWMDRASQTFDGGGY